MKKFNLNEFQSGTLGLTEDLRTVRYIGMNPDGGEYQKWLLLLMENSHRIVTPQINKGNDMKENVKIESIKTRMKLLVRK